MHSGQIEPFASNWAYLKAELHGLERLLLVAVARQRRDTREIDRLAQSKADRVTSHWWKGLMALDQEPAYDGPGDMPRGRSPRPPAAAASLPSYQQQLQLRIAASLQQGIFLGIPCLGDRLHLGCFERNLLLLCLAPEINQRYGRIYSYLQTNDSGDSRGGRQRVSYRGSARAAVAYLR
ncbi:hypothetical protein DO97_21370 [Neosynechococcus sphagnicola sy1]|uniref:Winged helix domain-containing protein n=1 Tax=Neosynechococcus sphagnicola sy1 TaxID=1497020 RepID=A0A098TRB9_9CYAN|nr:hypothetical protein [Neosynechococcus sphagnicola]KGF73348.1 hypothetical protein DO97_21370 [Neosynechococcus sphagnicola sy1]